MLYFYLYKKKYKIYAFQILYDFLIADKDIPVDLN